MDQQQAKFEGWALVEMMGHQKEAGYVTTEYFGGAAMFRIEIPAIEERTIVNEGEKETFHADFGYLKPGQSATSAAMEARTRLVAPGSLYAMNPCTETAARKAIEQMQRRPFQLVGAPGGMLEAPGEDDDEDDEGFF